MHDIPAFLLDIIAPVVDDDIEDIAVLQLRTSLSNITIVPDIEDICISSYVYTLLNDVHYSSVYCVIPRLKNFVGVVSMKIKKCGLATIWENEEEGI